MLSTLVLWALIYERYSFFRSEFKELSARHIADWQARKEHKSWMAHRIREMMISDAELKAHANLTYIKVLVLWHRFWVCWAPSPAWWKSLT